MKITILFAACLAVALGAIAWAGDAGQLRSEFFDNPLEVDKFVAQRRAEGPDGLAGTLQIFDAMKAGASVTIAATSEPGAGELASPDSCSRFAQIVDQIAGLRGATAARLYWYTDLEQAKSAAAKSGKPILSLRMLGKLTDEYSCANSRFFRTTLYTNKDIGDFLRDNYVLHWQSVRPVPVVTIDFGDGRKLERTLTGNSAHYILDATGRPLDVLPGLYSPEKFKEWLTESVAMFENYSRTEAGTPRDEYLVRYHSYRSGTADAALQRDLAQAAPETVPEVARPVSLSSSSPAKGNATSGATQQGSAPSSFTAREAGRAAVSKSDGEMPILTAILRTEPTKREEALPADVWERIALLPAHQVHLDAASREVIRRENPTATAAGARAASKLKVEDPLVRMVRTFEKSIALDSVRNEYLLHRQIHDWFQKGEASVGFDKLNERVYAELFLTPSSDPWLGLAPANVYTALDEGGLSASTFSKQ